MNNDPKQHEVEFEQEDLRAKPILWFMGVLAAILLAVYLAMHGLYAVLNAHDYKEAQKAQQNPLVTSTTDPEQRRATPYAQTHEEITHTFTEPRLEENERMELEDVRLQEEETLHSYDWVDEKSGIVRIPIERAMQLTAERGLPTRQTVTAAVPENAGGKKVSAKGN